MNQKYVTFIRKNNSTAGCAFLGSKPSLQVQHPSALSNLSTMASTAPFLQIITCNSGMTMTDKLQRHNQDTMEHKLDIVGEDGKQGSVILWKGENAFKAKLAAGDYQDKQRLWRRIKRDLRFDVIEAPTRASMLQSAKVVDDTKAVLVITGTLAEEGKSPRSFYEDSEPQHAAMGQAAGSIPGIVANIFLQATQGTAGAGEKAIGSCFFFSDEQSMEAYLASEAWAKSRAEMPCNDVQIERYAVVGGEVAAGA